MLVPVVYTRTMESHKHSLWIVPEGEAKATLDNIVTTFAGETGSATFIPHMTLIGDLIASEDEAIDVTRRIASQAAPLDLQLVEAEVMDEFYRCVFAKAEVSVELGELYAITHRVFPVASGEHFVKMPHLSVLYGEYDDATKQGYAERLREVLPIGWQATKLTLLYTEGQPENWRTVAEIPLGR